VPAWNQKIQTWVREGKLVVLGIAQEQYADRCRLFAQWHQLNWPILYDPINVMQVRGVPIEVAIDENGIVRSLRPDLKTFEWEFLDKTFSSKDAKEVEKSEKPSQPDLAALRRRAEQGNSFEAWRELGDALVLWGEPNELNHAIDAYTRALQIKPDDGNANFRLGVCYRMRYESPQRMSADFQMAVDSWTKAREIEPNRYIWRRRVEQFGPRATKPYPFYDWVETAIRDITARGDKPIHLTVLPTGSELAGPGPALEAKRQEVKPPDPQGRILRDAQNLILADVTVVPRHIKGGQTVRVHVTLRPNGELKAHWNNEAEPLRLWIDAPSGWKPQPQLLSWPQAAQPESSEPRHLEFEILSPADASGTTELHAYALYYVCEDTLGTCQFLRKDIPVTVTVYK
jgi:tetratricopeptide (TPR) repeat protein